MFKKLFSSEPDREKELARAAFEKVIAARMSDTRESRSARVRMGLLCRAHLDKTFINGAEQTAAHQAAVARAVIQRGAPPTPPQATEFQCISSGGRDIWVYLPEEYVQQSFSLGGKYQMTEISAEKAIVEMQNLADQLFMFELRLDKPFEVLQFLREELAGAAATPQPGDPAKR
jgi:hypothetical protein